MLSSEIRKKYIEFFKERGHVELPSASLIPENDSTTLFNTAGMQPLIPFLMGEPHPANSAIVNCQKCVRTGDIGEVGDSSHLTFFEMLGNWPLGFYGKKEAIEYSFEFLTNKKWLGIDPNKLYITVFEGDKDVEKDTESIKIWQECFKSIGIEAQENQRIFPLGKKDNFWGPVGASGPCGPDTEMFIDIGLEKCSDNCQPGCNCGKYIEIWNDVFMFYYKNLDGTYKLLDKPQIDTGFGLERATCILNNLDNVYDTDLFVPIVNEIKKLSNIENPDLKQLKSIRIISDHIRSAVFIMGDDLGICPSNLNQGYVVRRLIRNAIRHAKLIGIKDVFTFKIAEVIIELMDEFYGELKRNKNFIINQLIEEEKKFSKTLENGLKEFNKLNTVNGSDAFKLYSTYGFPVEMTIDLINERGLTFDMDEFNAEFGKHKELSRTASCGMFKGGLADHSEIVTKYHTATHLLHQALRETLGNHVEQRGSNLTTERMRFDFSHPDKLTPEQLQIIEDLVNKKIKESIPVLCELKPLDEAKKCGAIGLFGNKYGDQVNVYTIGDFSKEICGGPHVQNTSELGHFKIIKKNPLQVA